MAAALDPNRGCRLEAGTERYWLENYTNEDDRYSLAQDSLERLLVDMTVDEPVRIYLLMCQRTSCNAEVKEIC